MKIKKKNQKNQKNQIFYNKHKIFKIKFKINN